MDLRTRYLGLELPNPFLCGSGPLADDLDQVRRLEDAGAAGVVLRSLFEEQIESAAGAPRARPLEPGEASAPGADEYALGPEEYLEHLRRVKAAVAIPVVASLNGTSLGGWLAWARRLEEAGADALELNLYRVVTDPAQGAREVEEATVEIVAAVCDAVLLPVAVKLSPYYTSLAHLAVRLEEAGADGLVLFNRFYEPDVDLERLEVRPKLRLSSPQELLLRLHWLAILRGRLRGSLAATGGVHGAEDALKAIACGADAVQVVSELLEHGPSRLVELRRDLAAWLERHDVDALADLVGCLSLERCPDPEAYERVQYLRVLLAWEGGARAARRR
jgi:dihydroorotate dehydrogenase (fumarate)